jgi:hypothetical protein
MELPRNSSTPENDHLHFFSLRVPVSYFFHWMSLWSINPVWTLKYKIYGKKGCPICTDIPTRSWIIFQHIDPNAQTIMYNVFNECITHSPGVAPTSTYLHRLLYSAWVTRALHHAPVGVALCKYALAWTTVSAGESRVFPAARCRPRVYELAHRYFRGQFFGAHSGL